MRGLAVVLLLSPLLGASAIAQSAAGEADGALKNALAEEALANARSAKLEQAVANARNDAERLQASEAAASQRIEAAEARISAANLELRVASAYVAAYRERLALEQQPVSLLLAGLATMVRRPPLLVVADGGGSDELVNVRLLLDATLPVIGERTVRISAQLAQGRQLEEAAVLRRAELARSRRDLELRRQRFAELERKAERQAIASGGEALGASDVAIAAGESVDRLREQETGSQSIRRVAEVLAREPPLAPSPFPPDSVEPGPPFAYELPAAAPVLEGLGAVNGSGVLSRGLTLATSRGTPLAAPANGTIRFAGPYRDYDGVLIIDHGGGWLTLLVDAASTLHPGDTVQKGEEIGRALGPVQVELSRNGRRFSPALIAGSSGNLSNQDKGS